MQGSVAFKKAMRQAHSLTPLIQCYAEWNLNRYGNPVIDNAGFPEKDFGFNLAAFPIESVVGPIRPRNNQLTKGRTTDRADVDSVEGSTSKSRINWPTGGRSYTVGTTPNTYKNWSSPERSALTGSGGAFVIAHCNPQATYDGTYSCNKIRIVFADLYVKAKNWTVQLKLNGVWTTVATNPIVTNGFVELYLQDNGTWGSFINRNNRIEISGVAITVTHLNKPDSSLQLIELTGCYERELTKDVISWSVANSLSDESFLAPLGRASANGATVTLSNIDEESDIHGPDSEHVYKYCVDNATSEYYKIIDANTLIWLNVGIDTTNYGGSGIEWVRQFTMYSDSWSGQRTEEVTVSLKDSAKHLTEQLCPELVLENVTIAEAIWRLCDMVGFTRFGFEEEDYPYGSNDIYQYETYGTLIIPFFWTNPEKSIWETFSEMALATQTGIYFNEYNMLLIKTRAALDDELEHLPLVLEKADYTLRAVDRGNDLANVIDMSSNGDYEANTVNVIYKPTSITKDNNGFPSMEIMWESENETFRASPLAQPIVAASTFITLNTNHAGFWPYAALVNIEGELIRYDAKEWSYYDKTTGLLKTDWLTSDEQRDGINDNTVPEKLWKSGFTGKLRIKERGCFVSVPVDHTIDASGYSGRLYTFGSNSVQPINSQKTHLTDYSQLEFMNNSAANINTIHAQVRGTTNDQFMGYHGTRLMLPSTTTPESIAGICFGMNPSGESGYYVQLSQTSKTNRTLFNEVTVIVRAASGAVKTLGSVPFNVAPGVWYDVDINMDGSADQRIQVSINGLNVLEVICPQASKPPGWATGRHGMFVRGRSTARFEYFYAHVDGAVVPAIDDLSFQDRIRGGVASQYDREFMYSAAAAPVGGYVVKPSATTITRLKQVFMDDFGPYVHEVREYDIKFEKGVAMHSYLYMSNDYQLICPQYTSTAYGAKFIIGNYSRQNAVLSGDDNISMGADNTVNQRCLIYGRNIQVKDDQKITVKNDTMVKRRGEQSVEVESDWIQTKEAAQNMADWIVKKWSIGEARFEVTVFGNPLYRVGDVVLVDFPNADIPLDRKFVVVNVNTSGGDGGISTTLGLRASKV